MVQNAPATTNWKMLTALNGTPLERWLSRLIEF